MAIVTGVIGCNNDPVQKFEVIKKESVPDLQRQKKADSLVRMPANEIKKERFKSSLASYWKRSDNEFPFDTWLTEIKNKDSIANIKSEAEKLMKESAGSQMDTASFDRSAKWNLKCYYFDGYYGNYPQDFEKRHRYYQADSNKFALTSADIFEIFGISMKHYPIHFFPIVLGRHARYNKEWTAIVVNQTTMVIRFVNSYPDGNQTSVQYEKLYMFNKDN